MKKTIAVIMGGGQGTRLYPLTKLRSKPAVPLGGSYRLIDVPVSNCINSKIHRIFVLTQFNSASLNRHLSQTYTFDNFRGGFVEVLAAEITIGHSDWFQGTADAVRQNLRHFDQYDYENYMILAGDHLYRMDYREFIRFHEEQDADVSLAVYPVTEEEAPSFGIMKVDKGHNITDFVEKPKDPKVLNELRVNLPQSAENGAGRKKEFLASMGIYVFKRDLLHEMLNADSASDFGKEIIPRALENYKVKAFPFQGWWQDIGTIRTFYDANLALARQDSPFEFHYGDSSIYTHARFLPGSRLKDCVIKESLIAQGSELDKSNLTKCVIGIRSIIEKNCTLEGVVMMGADYYWDQVRLPANVCGKYTPVGIGENSIIKNAIIDKNARIGKNVKIINEAGLEHYDGSGYAIREGIVVVEKNACIPDDTVI